MWPCRLYYTINLETICKITHKILKIARFSHFIIQFMSKKVIFKLRLQILLCAIFILLRHAASRPFAPAGMQYHADGIVARRTRFRASADAPRYVPTTVRPAHYPYKDCMARCERHIARMERPDAPARGARPDCKQVNIAMLSAPVHLAISR